MIGQLHALLTSGRRMSVRLRLVASVTAAAVALASSPVQATVAYDEGISGDLSNSGLSPTSISFSTGDNIISGTTGKNAAGVVDRDYFTFTLGPNQFLTAIDVLPGTVPIGFSFIGLESGNQITLSPTTKTATGLLGWWHYSAADVGTDILDNMSVPAKGSSGFTPPLGPGTYSVWVQDGSPGTATYSFDFAISYVPEPASWIMMIFGFGMAGLAHRRLKSKQALRAA